MFVGQVCPRALSMEFKRSSASQQGTASEQGDPEADRQLREGLVWEARADGLVKQAQSW